MFQRIISRIFRGRHYWRSLSFDQVAELYVSRLVTVFAINVVNLFAAVYLYKLGYKIEFIALFYAVLYGLKIPFSIVCAKIAAYYGPKHGILYANLLRIPSLIAFALVPVAGEYAFVALVCFGVLQQMAATLYDLCYLVSFSKVRSVDNTGKELGTMQIIERAAKVASPLIGGILASLYTPEATIIVACVAFSLAAIPLFRSVEPTKTRAKLKLKGFPLRFAVRSIISQTVVGTDFVVSGMTWSLFITLFVFAHMKDGVYAAIGGLASLGMLISMISAWLFGQLVDRRKGDRLLAAGVVANTVIHLFRPFVTTPAGVMGVSIANETATSAYALPFTRVLFDVADSSGFRIAYMMCIEMAVNFGAMMACLVLWCLVGMFGVETGIKTLFVLAAGYELFLLLSRRAAR